ncbi:hypothetical protein HOD30_03945 [Candidatus Peregrinibacteria bacterium]|jgi:hypothetical protein|nr:hypothetical protein [Candidatus Peregrinibacteria bacterium]MBT4632096.1 hypothetical protein [Candidatus Peregrinibacteria bacterium]MBT5516524.1 hypothetical protein [Candidatus Peregrinibacteria bacterium]MBT5823562.1 hypothetical protein [Candidatus Peregrinibacteria bacterium]
MTHNTKAYSNYKFPGQKPGEVIQLLVRKHWIIDVKIAAIFAFLALIPGTVAVVSPILLWDGVLTDTILLIIIGVLVYFLFMMLITYIKWLNEELDIIIVTNERIVAHDQIDLFHRQVSETNIGQIQDVKGIERGMLGSIFHYGKLEMQTAARDIMFKIQHVRDPYNSARIILDIRDQYIDKEKFEQKHESLIHHT